MSYWGTREISPVEEPEPGEDFEHDPELEPAITLSKKDAKQFYHGIGRTTYFVELPDGSHGQLVIAPREYDRTLRAKIRKQYLRFTHKLSAKLSLDERFGTTDGTSQKDDGGR